MAKSKDKDEMKRKIYFSGSKAGGRQDAPLYKQIIEELKEYGEVLSEHVGDASVEEDDKRLEGKDFKRIHDQDITWIKESEYVVAEVTQPTLGVGYAIGRAKDYQKTILCLFRQDSRRRLSSMIQGAQSGTTFVVKYYAKGETKASTLFHNKPKTPEPRLQYYSISNPNDLNLGFSTIAKSPNPRRLQHFSIASPKTPTPRLQRYPIASQENP